MKTNKIIPFKPKYIQKYTTLNKRRNPNNSSSNPLTQEQSRALKSQRLVALPKNLAHYHNINEANYYIRELAAEQYIDVANLLSWFSGRNYLRTLKESKHIKFEFKNPQDDIPSLIEEFDEHGNITRRIATENNRLSYIDLYVNDGLTYDRINFKSKDEVSSVEVGNSIAPDENGLYSVAKIFQYENNELVGVFFDGKRDVKNSKIDFKEFIAYEKRK